MRLNPAEVDIIQAAFRATFHQGELYLFGSRVDDSKRGGDIDLYVVPAQMQNLSATRIDFLVKLKQGLGEQKIDVVVDRGGNRLIDTIAKQQGELICQL
ncbi:MAG: nucleotidyltransferase domain-containing protein [Sulfuriferula sp.]|nr:nucleotidyltransferase domain-containing protein [Sulfuriferula sp.]